MIRLNILDNENDVNIIDKNSIEMLFNHLFNYDNLDIKLIHPIFTNNIIPNDVISRWVDSLCDNIIQNKFYDENNQYMYTEYNLIYSKIIKKIRNEFKYYEQYFFSNLYILKNIVIFLINDIKFNEKIFIDNWDGLYNSEYDLLLYYDIEKNEYIHINIPTRLSYFELTNIELIPFHNANNTINMEFIELKSYCMINNKFMNGIFYIIEYDELNEKKIMNDKILRIKEKYNNLVKALNNINI